MESNAIYEKNFLKDCLGELKQLRLQWGSGQWHEERLSGRSNIPISMCNLGGSDNEQYSFIMRESAEYVYQAICKTIFDLAQVHDIACRRVLCNRCDAYLYYGKSGIGPLKPLGWKRLVHALCMDNNGDKVIFVIKEPGVFERLPRDVVQKLNSVFQTTSLMYVSLAEKDVEKEDLSHNGDVIGIGEFLRDQFSLEEESRFFNYFEQFKTKANDIFGLKVTKALQHMELGTFRSDLLTIVQKRAYPINVMGKALAETQRIAIEKHYFEEGRCRAAVGGSDFAKSFITAEWLYSSLRGATNVDLSPVALGYFKALEQFLASLIIALSICDGDESRKLHVGDWSDNKIYWKVDGCLDKSRWISVEKKHIAISSDLLAEGFQYAFDLGRLARFFGDWDKTKSVFYSRNKDLLYSEIDNETYEAIVLTLQSLRTMRNGYLHKDNLYEWSEVDEVRNRIYTVFYLMLGSYRLDKRAMEYLDALKPECLEDFDKLCVYIDRASRKKLDLPGISVFYFGRDPQPGDFCLASPAEDDPVIDRLGRVVAYPAAYFRGPETRDGYDLKITIENVPSVISEGRLLFETDDSGGIKFDITGPEKIIFEAGQFTE